MDGHCQAGTHFILPRFLLEQKSGAKDSRLTENFLKDYGFVSFPENKLVRPFHKRPDSNSVFLARGPQHKTKPCFSTKFPEGRPSALVLGSCLLFDYKRLAGRFLWLSPDSPFRAWGKKTGKACAVLLGRRTRSLFTLFVYNKGSCVEWKFNFFTKSLIILNDGHRWFSRLFLALKNFNCIF